jgi:hypothetical protein
MSQNYILLDGVTGTGAGDPIPVGDQQNVPIRIPVQISGITVATVVMQATLDDQGAVNGGTAVWETIVNGSFTANTMTSLDTAYRFIRGNVTAWTSGTITVRARF